MMNYVKSSQDVLAMRIRDGLSPDEIEELIRRLQDKIDKNPKTHVFVDIDRFRAEDWKSAFEALPHSWGLFRLDRYGRIAVVSDDKFVRTWSRIESAVLPRIHYEIFHADERNRALEWVEGKIDEPHEAALKFIETNNPLVLAYSVDGTMSKADMEQAIVTTQPRLSRELGPISVLGRFGEVRFSDPTSLFDERYLRFKRDTLARVERYAIVGGPAWLQLMIEATAPFVPFDLRYFEEADEAAAWEWVGARERGKVSDAAAAEARIPA
jgi:hypothetical protein